ncbi:MAG: agmatinase [archaeon]|jgi:agmatinase
MPLNSKLTTFLDKPNSLGSDFILFSAPLDLTTSNRNGTRFGPDAVRRESHFLESFSSRFGLGWDDLSLSDIGDVECSNVEKCLTEVERFINEVDGFPVMLGGEHTITLGALRALKPELVVVFDAHLDLRDELFGERVCHASYLRRAVEELGCKVLVVGARALSREEVDYADRVDDVAYILAREMIYNPLIEFRRISKIVDSVDSIYISIDMDVLDPAYAPAVGNPHPEGLSTNLLMDSIEAVMRGPVVGLDLNEVYPHYDQGVTATTAAYIVLESLYCYLRYHGA